MKNDYSKQLVTSILADEIFKLNDYLSGNEECSGCKKEIDEGSLELPYAPKKGGISVEKPPFLLPFFIFCIQ